MSVDTFLIITGVVFLASIALGLFGRPARGAPPKPPSEEFKRWSVFRIHLDRLFQGGGPAVEALPGGPVLTLQGAPRKSRLCLVDAAGRDRIQIQIRRRFSRKFAKIILDRYPFAEVWPCRRKGRPVEILSEQANIQVARGAGEGELELRRGGKLVASISPEIAAQPSFSKGPRPRTTGLEILMSENTFHILALVTAMGFLQVLPSPKIAGGKSVKPSA